MANQSSSAKLKELQAENLRLKRENADIKKQTNAKGSKKDPLSGLRTAAVIILVALSIAIIAVGNILFWTGSTIVNTNRFISTVEPVVRNTQVQEGVALYATNQLFSSVNVQGYIQQVLPPRADFLAPQLASQVKSFTNSALKKTLATTKVQNVFINVLRNQHQRLVTFSKNYKGNGQISINDLYQQLTANLKDTKLSFLAGKQLPSSVGNITVVTASWLPAFRNVVVHINMWRVLAVLAALVSLGLAIFLSRSRLHLLYVFGWAMIGSLLAMLVAVRIVREQISNHVNAQYAAAVNTATQLVLHPLVIQTVYLILLAVLLIIVVAFFDGKFHWVKNITKKVWVKLNPEDSELLNKWRASTFALWLKKHKRPSEVVVGIIALLLLLVIQPSWWALIIILLIAAAVIVFIEVLTNSNPKTIPKNNNS